MEHTATVSYSLQSLCRNIFRPEQLFFSRLKPIYFAVFLTICCLADLSPLRAQTICPTITNTAMTSLTICTGQVVDSLEVNTSIVLPDRVEFVRFDTMYTNPYKGHGGVHLGEFVPINGKATQYNISFPAQSGTTDRVYYVYACVKPMPSDTNCAPWALITVTVRPNSVANVVVKEATCFGTVSQADGELSLSGYAPTDTYEVSSNGTFTGLGQAIPANGIIVSGLSRTGTAVVYSVRIYNAQGCYVDRYATVLNRNCDCPPAKCIPIAIQRAE
ncbi:hypothetical protein GCM10028807_28940 [Spirosoma daeguense]